MAELKKGSTKVSFGKGLKESFTKADGMIYFATDTNEILIKDASFGLSVANAELLNASLASISYAFDSTENAGVFTVTTTAGEENTFSIPVASDSANGLMTIEQVELLAKVETAAEFLLGAADADVVDGKKSVLRAEADAKAYADGLVNALDLAEVKTEGMAIISVKQENGQVSATAGSIAAQHVDVADEENNFTGETVEAVLAEIAGKIADLNEGSEDADGLIEEAQKAIAAIEEKLGNGFSKDSTVAGKIEEVANSVESLKTNEVAANTKGVADNKAAIEKEAGDRAQAIIDAVSALKGTLADGEAATLEGIHDRIDEVEAAAGAISYKIEKTEGTADSPIKATYTLRDKDNNQVGEAIEIYKDSSIISITLVDQAPVGENDAIVEGQYLEYKYINVNGKEEVEYVDVSAFLTQAEFGNGLDVSSAGVVSVKVDSSSEYLTVGSNGVKVSGVDSAIETATGNLEIKLVGGATTYTTFGSVEDHFEVIDGKVEALEGASEDLTEAIAAAEKAAKDHADSKVKELADGAVKTNTDAVAAIKTSVGLGDGYSFAAADTNYVSESASVKDAIVALDNAVKVNEDALTWFEG